ncbi:RNA polymerase sigma factor SigY [Bacillus sp. REN3]|uniref:RNA polymerase sigma factor SigY n=1 Tax=Bacillus sp. REN3 TaxID=2802440 RepID=UPI001AEE0FF7|nr:RNA polymerase sigma factor SigY [Bacillus sp. REN3]
MNEIELIRSAKKGDHRSFAILFRSHYPILVKYLMKITMNPDLAEDIAQEAMAKCVEKIHLFSGKSKFSSWLITIATNIYIDQQRRKKREREWNEGEAAIRRLQWQMESRNEEWTDALAALGKLGEEMRIPLVLKHYYGYSYDEIGETLNIASGTAKSRVHHALLAVRRELKLDDRPKTNTTK